MYILFLLYCLIKVPLFHRAGSSVFSLQWPQRLWFMTFLTYSILPWKVWHLFFLQEISGNSRFIEVFLCLAHTQYTKPLLLRPFLFGQRLWHLRLFIWQIILSKATRVRECSQGKRAVKRAGKVSRDESKTAVERKIIERQLAMMVGRIAGTTIGNAR